MANPDYTFQLNTIGNTITGITVEDNLFKHHAPKPKGIKAVKLSKDNLDAVAKRIRERRIDAEHRGAYRTKEDAEVTVGNHYIGLGRRLESPVDKRHLGFSDGTLDIGDWVVEEFNYVGGYTIFRVATLAEREKHDLR